VAGARERRAGDLCGVRLSRDPPSAARADGTLQALHREYTDIVEKEMYTFTDRGGESLTLRPEATAGIVRACLSNGLLHNQRQKVWCAGRCSATSARRRDATASSPDRRRGARLRGPDVDAELILMSARLWKRLGLTGLTLHLNSLGTPSRARSTGQDWWSTSAATPRYSTRTAGAGSTATRCASSTARTRRCARSWPAHRSSRTTSTTPRRGTSRACARGSTTRASATR